ncbi:hypothetical protein CPB86DRAFT_875730 [Serendipita vermifera]|nr:hypothetical protein CPB86DRAFT_875730 [Serendipita vermifera]
MKRAAESQLTRENQEEDDSGSEVSGGFKRASENELAKRNIRPMPKRRGGSGSPAPSPAPMGGSSSSTSSLPPLGSIDGKTTSLPSLPSTGFTFKLPSSSTSSTTPFNLSSKPSLPSSFASFSSSALGSTGPSSTAFGGATATNPTPSFSFGKPLPEPTKQPKTSSNGSMTNTAQSMSSIFSSISAENDTATSKNVDKSKGTSSASAGFAFKPSTAPAKDVNPKTTTSAFSGSFGTTSAPSNSSKRASTGASNLKPTTSTGTFGLGPNSRVPTESPTPSPNDVLPPFNAFGSRGKSATQQPNGRVPHGPNDYISLSSGDSESFEDQMNEDIGLDPEEINLETDPRQKLHTDPEHQAYEAELKLWLHLRGLNLSLIKELMRMQKADPFVDLSGAFKSYRDYRKQIVAEYDEWARTALGEEADAMDQDTKAHYAEEDDEGSEVEIDLEREGGTDDVIQEEVHEDIQENLQEPAEEDPDKTPPATAKPPVPMPSLPKAPVSSTFTFGGKTVSSSGLSDTSTSSSSKPSGFTLSSGVPATFSFGGKSISSGSTTTTPPATTPSQPASTDASSGFGLSKAPATFSFGATASTTTAATPPKPADTTTTTSSLKPASTFPGFGPLTGGPPGSPFGTTAKSPSNSAAGKSPTANLFAASTTSSPPTSQPSATSKPLGTWPASSPEAAKPGGLFGAPPASSFGTAAAKPSGFSFSFGTTSTAPSKENTTFGSSTTVPADMSSAQPPSKPSPFGSFVFPPKSTPSFAPASSGASTTTAEKPKETSETGEDEGTATPKAAPRALSGFQPPVSTSSTGIANPWASNPSTPGSAFKFGMGSKPAAPDDSSPVKSTPFSFADPPTSFKAPSSSGFSFADPPKTASAASGPGFVNPFASPPKVGTLFGAAALKPFGSSTTPSSGSGSSASASPFGSQSNPFATTSSATTNLFGGTPRGPSFTSTSSSDSAGGGVGSSQETTLAQPIQASGSSGSLAGGDPGLPGEAGTSQESGDVAPEGTGLALGEDKFDQPGPGEEMEESLFNVRGKVMRFSGTNWADMGIGQIRIYKHKETGAKRIFARNSKSGRILLNFAPFAKMEPKIDDHKAKFMRMTAMDEGKLVKILVKLKEEKEASGLVAALQKEVDALS